MVSVFRLEAQTQGSTNFENLQIEMYTLKIGTKGWRKIIY